MLRPAVLTTICAALALGAAACGQSASGGAADPATLVPAGAAFYLEAAVQPQGDRREDALAAAGKLLRTDDPSGRLRELVDERLAQDGDGLTWEGDFAPWLGENAGVWAADVAGDEPSVAVIVATADAEAAKATLERFSAIDGARGTPRSHAGTNYEVDPDGEAFGMIGDFVVAGTEDAFKRTAEISEGGDRLADAGRYKDAVGELEEERLGHYYVDVKPLVDAALEQDPATAAQLEQFKSILPLDELGPVTGSFQADGDGLALDTVLTGIPEGPFRDLAQLWSGGEAGLMAELPGDAWGAFVTPELGDAAQELFSAFAGAIGGAAVAAQVRQATGLDLQEDVFAWVGDVGMFVRGTGPADLGGALVIEATDDGKATTAFGKLVGLVGKQTGAAPTPVPVEGAEAAFEIVAPGAPEKIVLARGKGRVVAAYGRQAATDALDSDAPLGDADAYGDAEEILGEDMQPSFLLSLPAVIELADAMGATDAELDEARPYLEALGVLTSGGAAGDDRVRSRVAVTLR